MLQTGPFTAFVVGVLLLQPFFSREKERESKRHFWRPCEEMITYSEFLKGNFSAILYSIGMKVVKSDYANLFLLNEVIS